MKLSITGSVGRAGQNNAHDVKLICALLNIFHRQKNRSPLPIMSESDGTLVQAIEQFQKDYQRMPAPDGQVTSSSSLTFVTLVRLMKSTRTIANITPPKRGGLTWSAEGNEGGLFHSRVLHVPSPASGLTIGRGYDMRNRSSAEIRNHLFQAGVQKYHAKNISGASGLSGASAQQFIIDNDLLDYEISALSQLKLFELIYLDYVATVKRICESRAVVAQYGKTDWDALDPYILDVVVDLTFRGDYHVRSRKVIQKSIADNDFETFKKLITDRSRWGGWPPNRFARRKEYLQEARRKRRLHTSVRESMKVEAKHSLPKLTGAPV
jgi:hypothetical protein